MTKSEEKPQLSTETMAHRVSHIGSQTNGTFSTNCSAVKLLIDPRKFVPESCSSKAFRQGPRKLVPERKLVQRNLQAQRASLAN